MAEFVIKIMLKQIINKIVINVDKVISHNALEVIDGHNQNTAAFTLAISLLIAIDYSLNVTCQIFINWYFYNLYLAEFRSWG